MKTIRINRAPVLTLWAVVVAERLGFDRDEALSLGRAGHQRPRSHPVVWTSALPRRSRTA
jgi:hypothetical protein